MLVLARKEDESIVIGNDIRLHVRKISPTRVRIAIEAPPHVRVTRLELQEALDAELPVMPHHAEVPSL